MTKKKTRTIGISESLYEELKAVKEKYELRSFDVVIKRAIGGTLPELPRRILI